MGAGSVWVLMCELGARWKLHQKGIKRPRSAPPALLRRGAASLRQRGARGAAGGRGSRGVAVPLEIAGGPAGGGAVCGGGGGARARLAVVQQDRRDDDSQVRDGLVEGAAADTRMGCTDRSGRTEAQPSSYRLHDNNVKARSDYNSTLSTGAETAEWEC